jgi:hypothetical protein
MRRHKFNATRCELDGLKFASKLERDYYAHLKLLEKSGEVVYFHWQIPIRLPGGSKCIVDFQVFYSDGTVRYLDTKGIETDSFKIKRREIEAVYPFKIETVKRGDF